MTNKKDCFSEVKLINYKKENRMKCFTKFLLIFLCAFGTSGLSAQWMRTKNDASYPIKLKVNLFKGVGCGNGDIFIDVPAGESVDNNYGLCVIDKVTVIYDEKDEKRRPHHFDDAWTCVWNES